MTNKSLSRREFSELTGLSWMGTEGLIKRDVDDHDIELDNLIMKNTEVAYGILHAYWAALMGIAPMDDIVMRRVLLAQRVIAEKAYEQALQNLEEEEEPSLPHNGCLGDCDLCRELDQGPDDGNADCDFFNRLLAAPLSPEEKNEIDQITEPISASDRVLSLEEQIQMLQNPESEISGD